MDKKPLQECFLCGEGKLVPKKEFRNFKKYGLYHIPFYTYECDSCLSVVGDEVSTKRNKNIMIFARRRQKNKRPYHLVV